MTPREMIYGNKTKSRKQRRIMIPREITQGNETESEGIEICDFEGHEIEYSHEGGRMDPREIPWGKEAGRFLRRS